MAAIRATRPYIWLNGSVCSRCTRRIAASGLRWSSTSTEGSPPPLLSKIKNDLKVAMRAKDTARLTFLRGTISEINQAASSSSPIKTDMQILALLRKRKSASENAKKEAEAAKRPDLAEKQDKEIGAIDEFVGTVKMIEADAMSGLVRNAIEALKSSVHGGEVKQGAVMKELLKPGGDLEGKLYEGKTLVDMVKQELSRS